MDVPNVVKEVVDYFKTGNAGTILTEVHRRLGDRELRVVCIELLGWWGSQYLMVSRHPYLLAPTDSPRTVRLRTVFALVAELSELVEERDWAFHFRAEISDELKRTINEYIREHFHPRLMTKDMPPTQ